MNYQSLHKQFGLASLEFALIGSVFFIVLFGIIEFGRLLYTWNLLTEASRRGARVAVVCTINNPAIKRIAIYTDLSSDTPSPVIPGLTVDNVNLSYVDTWGTNLPNPPTFSDIRFVRVAIEDYEYQMFIPFLSLTLDAPGFATTLPRESLGIPRDGATPECPFPA